MIKTISEILKNQGWKYVLFRTTYEVKRKLGLLKKKFPTVPNKGDYLSKNEWKALNITFVVKARENVNIPKTPNHILKGDAEKILSGSIKYFNKEWKKVDDWHTNPDSGYIYDANCHWTEIEDLSEEAGDIKFVWEKSRFSWLYQIIRYDYHFEKDNSEFVFSTIENWIDSNPINLGPHYKCSQETSLRCINWIFALYFYQNSTSISEDRWQKIIHSIFWQVKHVYSNINFSRICVRNNHAVTECMMIYFAGLLFPFFEESAKWKKLGKKWLEEEINYQIYSDGTFLQFSHNYHRVLLQLLTLTVSLSKLHEVELQQSTIIKIKKTLNYMRHCCIGNEGQMPNYGSNDGALFFKLNDCDYSDFRPQINALYNTVYHGGLLKKGDNIREDEYWLTQNIDVPKNTEPLSQEEPLVAFDHGGIFTLKDRNVQSSSFTFFKCASYKDRPAHADNMHIDIWVNGENLFRDSGTYKYNTDKELINYFAGTKGHNTVMIDDHNQMEKGPRFIWYNWTKNAKVNEIQENDFYGFKAFAEMFPTAGKNISHTRKLLKSKTSLQWIIKDTIENKLPNQKTRQIWHPNPQFLDQISIIARDMDGKVIDKTEEIGYWSEYYGQLEKVPIWIFETESSIINTTINVNF